MVRWCSNRRKCAATDGSSESGYSHRMYCTTTKDFVTFTPTRLFYDPGFSVIDATILPVDGRYYLIVERLHGRPLDGSAAALYA